MSDKFILKIKNIIKETKDCVSIALDIPAEDHILYVQVHLKMNSEWL